MSSNSSAPNKGAKGQNKDKETTTTNTHNKSNNFNNNRQNNNTNNTNNNNTRQYPEDKNILEFEKKFDDIHKQLKAHGEQTKKLRDEQEQLKVKKNKIKEEIDQISADNKAILPMIQKNKEQKIHIDALIKDHENKKNILNDITKNLPIKVNASSTKSSMLEEIEKKVQAIETKIENERDLLTQRYLLRELKDINAQKRSIDEYFDQKDAVRAVDQKISEAKKVRKDINDEIDKLLGPDRKKDNKSTKEGETTESAIKPKGSEEETNNADGEKKKRIIDPNSPLGKLYTARNGCSDRSKEIYNLLKGDYTKNKLDLEAQLETLKKEKAQYIKDRNEKRAEERKKRDEERKKSNEEYKAKKESEREQKRLAEVPYEDEIFVCEDLHRYLETITPKETKVVEQTQSTQSEVEGYTLLAKKEKPTRGKKPTKASPQQQQPTTENIRHSFDTIIAFEKISVSLPKVVSDIQEAKTQVQAKLENYKKLSTKAVEEREKQIADKKVAEAQASESTTTTTTETPKVEVEAQ